MLSEVTVIAEENLTKSKIFLSFFVFVYFGKKQEWIKKKKKSAKTLLYSLASLYSLIRQYKSMKVRYSQQCSSLEYGHMDMLRVGCDKDDHISIKMSYVFTFFEVML